jgi:hypothetical protein
MNGWEFHYKNWKAEEFDEKTYARTGAMFGDLKPDSRKGCLDVNVLRKHGLNAERMCNGPLSFTNCYSLFVLPLTKVLLMITACHFIPTFACLPTFLPCGRVQEADTDMISLRFQFLNLFTGLVSPFAMVHWMVDRQRSSIVGRSMIHDTILLLQTSSISADGVR